MKTSKEAATGICILAPYLAHLFLKGSVAVTAAAVTCFFESTAVFYVGLGEQLDQHYFSINNGQDCPPMVLPRSTALIQGVCLPVSSRMALWSCKQMVSTFLCR